MASRATGSDEEPSDIEHEGAMEASVAPANTSEDAPEEVVKTDSEPSSSAAASAPLSRQKVKRVNDQVVSRSTPAVNEGEEGNRNDAKSDAVHRDATPPCYSLGTATPSVVLETSWGYNTIGGGGGAPPFSSSC